MNHKGIEFTLVTIEPGLWRWQFSINETITTGKIKTRLEGAAARRAKQRIDRELKSQGTCGEGQMLPKRGPREERVVPLTRVTYSLEEFCKKTGQTRDATLRSIAEGSLRTVKVGHRQLILDRQSSDSLSHKSSNGFSPQDLTDRAPVKVRREAIPEGLRGGIGAKMEQLLHRNSPEQGPSIIHISSGQPIFLEGDQFSTVEVLSSGFARLHKISMDGQRQIIGFALPGDILEMSFASRHMISVDAIGSVSVYRFLKHRFVSDLRRNPDLLFAMLEFANVELSIARSQIILLGSPSAKERLIQFLIEWRNRLARVGHLSNTLPLPMTRSDIAECIGLRLETVCRAFAELERENVLRAVPKGLHLLGSRQQPLLLRGRHAPN